jgi:exonuclease VII small subunit
MGRDDTVHPERLQRAADELTEATELASESRHHLERAADRLEELVQIWKKAPEPPAEQH